MNKSEQLIACLEGEIAKRDETIARLEPQLNRAIQANYDLREELARVIRADAHYQAEVLRLAAELAAIKAQDPVAWPEGGSDAVEGAALGAFDSLGQPEHDLESWCAGYAEAVYAHAAPVSEAKAHGVVMPEGWIPLTIEHEPGYPEDVAFGPKRMMDRLKKWLDRYFEMRLNAAHVQQVSVPDISRLLEALERVATLHIIPPYTTPQSSQLMMLKGIADQALESYRATAPAAPTADALLVEALDYQVLFDAIAAATSVYANGAINISVQAFRDALAAHRAKEVV